MKLVGCIGSQGDVLYHIEQCNAFADLIEIRLDLFFDKQYLDLFPLCKKPIIATLRHHTHGGKFHGDQQGRVKLLKEAIAHGAIYVDIEGEFFERLSGTKMIASFHNFSSVPEDLQQQYDALAKLDCDIVKIAVNANNDSELIQVNALRYAKPSACFSMPHLKSRMRNENALVYCAPEEGATLAPGQISLEQARKML